MTLGAKLWWKEHNNEKSDELNIKFRIMYWLLGRNSELLAHNRLILYRQVICPVWSNGIQLRGWTSDSSIEMIQRYQNKVLKCIVSALRYVRNSDHRDFVIQTVTDTIAKFANSHEMRLQNKTNIEASRLLNVNNITRRLKWKKEFDLCGLYKSSQNILIKTITSYLDLILHHRFGNAYTDPGVLTLLKGILEVFLC
jgi:hypothetical protein